MRRLSMFGLWSLILALLLSAAVFPSAVAGAPVLPEGFNDTLVARVASPTALAFTPDGRMLITTQPGRVYIYQNGALQPTPALDLINGVCSRLDTGLLSVAVDPLFSTNRFIYLFYTYKKYGNCSTGSGTFPVQRISRFVLGDNNLIAPTSEVVLIDNVPSPHPNHAGGDLDFGQDGYLYVTFGDGGCHYADPTKCQGTNDASRDQHVLLGKLARITRDGDVPPDNPYTGPNSARCALTGSTEPGKYCRETFATGLRSPFRMAFDPNASGTRFFINDVGYHAWEEINLGVKGADYGWNVREGRCQRGGEYDCKPTPAGMTDPLYAYSHRTGCTGITGGAFVPRGLWPAVFEDAYLYGDYVCGKIFRLVPTDSGYRATEFITGLGTNGIVDMRFGPYGDTQALYYTTYNGLYTGDSGEVRRISYVGATNRAPTAVLTATPRAGLTPLTVVFDGSASYDPDSGDTLTYLWTFDDSGVTRTTNEPTTSYTYTRNQTVTATLRVRDNHGAESAPATIRIDAGNAPPTPAILAPDPAARFGVGEVIALQGQAFDPETGTLPDTALEWRVLLHHNDHYHQLVPPTRGNNLTFTAPAPEELPATTTSYLEIQLTATDPAGITSTVSQALRPRLVEVHLDSAPRGATLEVNDLAITTPHTVTSWEGYELRLRAFDQAGPNGRFLTFESWSHGMPAEHQLITPATPLFITANYRVNGTWQLWLPLVSHGRPAR